MTPTQREVIEAYMDAVSECGLSQAAGAGTVARLVKAERALLDALAEPAPVQEPAKKGLFVDLIAQHPGLAENLMAIDAVPLPEWKPPLRLTDAIQTAVRKQFGVNVEAAPPADVPMLTEDEIVVALHVALPSLSYDSEDAFINGVRAGEQAVRQKAGW